MQPTVNQLVMKSCKKRCLVGLQKGVSLDLKRASIASQLGVFSKLKAYAGIEYVKIVYIYQLIWKYVSYRRRKDMLIVKV